MPPGAAPRMSPYSRVCSVGVAKKVMDNTLRRNSKTSFRRDCWPPLPTALTCSPSDGLARPSHGQGRGHMMLEQHKEHQAQNRDTPGELSSAQAVRALTSLQGNDPGPRPLWPCDRREAVQDSLSLHDTCSLLKGESHRQECSKLYPTPHHPAVTSDVTPLPASFCAYAQCYRN